MTYVTTIQDMATFGCAQSMAVAKKRITKKLRAIASKHTKAANAASAKAAAHTAAAKKAKSLIKKTSAIRR